MITAQAMPMNPHLMKWAIRCKKSLGSKIFCAADEFDRFTRRLLSYKQEVQSGKRKKENEEFYERFLKIRSMPKRGLQVSFNEEEIQKYRKRYAGFFCILSSKVKNPIEALHIYT